MTGILAFLISCNTGSQPVSTTGENAMTSTPWAMKDRSALIWFSCFCCASENTSSTPRLAASDLIESVFAVRHPLSAPIWENPTVTFFLPPESPVFSASALFFPQEERKLQLRASATRTEFFERICRGGRGLFIGYLVN